MSNTIYFLWDYNWLPAKLVRENKKTYTIFVERAGFVSHERRVPKEKCAFPNELVCVVWERAAGVNGRGAYRVERVLYPNQRIPASQVYRQHCGIGRITE